VPPDRPAVVWVSRAGGDTSGVGELRGGTDEPDRHDRLERHIPEASGDSGVVRARVEPRSRAEYAADLEQRAVSGWDQQPYTSWRGDPKHDLPGRWDGPLDMVRRFEPGRAGLADISPDDAAAYIHAHQDSRPWLAAASGCLPEVHRVFAALDQGGGHGHIRHEGWVTEEMNHRRVAYLEDPAQPDPAKRAAGIDGLRPGDQPHRCRQTATRITDPDAFAAAFARGIEHPRVRAALETPFHPDSKPFPVQLPLGELLGPDGHRYCTGWRLEPVDGNMTKARASREAWIAAPAEKRASDVREPTARPVETFEGGTAVFVFGHNSRGDGYEVVTMYPRPPDQEG
jgi:hypothetical protein